MATKRERSQVAREPAERATGTGAKAADIGRQQAERAKTLMSASTKAYQDVAGSSKDDVEAIMQSGARLAQGMQEVGWEMVNFTNESLRCGLRAANDLMECRSVEDMVAVQRDYVKESVDIFLSESAKLLRMTSSTANEAVTPISQRVGGE